LVSRKFVEGLVEAYASKVEVEPVESYMGWMGVGECLEAGGDNKLMLVFIKESKS
jgi:hypothetical protein